MNRFPAIFILVLLWTVWCFLHSLLISRAVTARAKEILGPRYGYYRIAYNLFSLVTVVPVIYFQSELDEKILFAWPWPWNLLKYIMYAGGFLLFYTGARVYDLKVMLGVKQIREMVRGGTMEEVDFTTDGILGYVRHPWYSGAILLIWAFGDVTDVSLVVKIVLTFYIIIGAVLEEKKLVSEIGDQYNEYRRKVPMLIPWKVK